MFRAPRPPAVAVFLLAFASPALAQSLSVTLLPGAVSFTLANNSATNAGSTSLAVTTLWTLQPSGRTISVYAYFPSATAALTPANASNTTTIPATRVEASVNGGAHAPLSDSVPFGGVGAGRLLATQVITTLTGSSQRSDTLALNINLNSYRIPADTYGSFASASASVAVKRSFIT